MRARGQRARARPRAGGRPAGRAARALRLHRRLLAARHRRRRPRGHPRPGDPVQARAVVAAEPHAAGARSSPASSSWATRTRTAARRPRRPRPSIATRASWCGASSTRTSPASARSSPSRPQRLRLDEELVAAKMVGRWRDGSPLALRPHGPDPALGNDKERANDFRYGDDELGPALPARRARAAHEPARRARLGGPADGAPPDPAPGHARTARPCPTARRTTARRAGCSSSACRPRSRASSRSSRRSGATTATPSAWAARPTRSAARPGARCATSSRASRRASRRPCAATSSAAAASTSSCRRSARCGRCPACRRAVTKRHGERGTHARRGPGTPFHAKSRPRVRPPLEPGAMTSREHARRLMLILLTSEGTALRKAADDRMLRREQTRPSRRVAKESGGPGASRSPVRRASAVIEEWRLWAALPPMGAAPRAP